MEVVCLRLPATNILNETARHKAFLGAARACQGHVANRTARHRPRTLQHLRVGSSEVAFPEEFWRLGTEREVHPGSPVLWGEDEQGFQ